ncbi:hypothetical protein [Pseudomonas knackmussii]|uniref:hypothetical protein n=1 Tax=Pseudomonas knackmussii TaxID=65741 RepID=UPI003F4A7127
MNEVMRVRLAWNKPRPDMEEKAYPPGTRCSEFRTDDFVLASDYDALKSDAQALKAEISRLHSTMIAAAEEIHEHWDAHCDEEGYGPSNLMYRLEKCIDADYPGYTAGAFAQIREEVAALRARVVVVQEPVTMDGKTTIREHVANAAPVDLPMCPWTQGYEECKRRIHAMFEQPCNKSLNGKAVSEGLLRRVCNPNQKFPIWEDAAREILALLDEGKEGGNG